MQYLGSALGLGGGYQSQSGESTTNKTESGSQTSSGTTANTYAPGQTGLQGGLLELLSSLLPGMAAGKLTPNVQAMKTASADSINKNYAGLGDRMNRFLAARGFGKSGQAGKAALETELGRQGALAGDESKFAGLQLDQNTAFLSDALKAAYQPIGTKSDSLTSFMDLLNSLTKSTGSGWGIAGQAGASFGPK